MTEESTPFMTCRNNRRKGSVALMSSFRAYLQGHKFSPMRLHLGMFLYVLYLAGQ